MPILAFLLSKEGYLEGCESSLADEVAFATVHAYFNLAGSALVSLSIWIIFILTVLTCIV